MVHLNGLSVVNWDQAKNVVNAFPQFYVQPNPTSKSGTGASILICGGCGFGKILNWFEPNSIVITVTEHQCMF